MKLLIVRLGALGDIVHAVPAAAALRRRFPSARIDWIVDRRYAPVLELAEAVDRPIVIDTSKRWWDLPNAIRRLRHTGYDVAVDLQGLIKSAMLARLSGAPRVIGFERAALREPAAALFYTERRGASDSQHVILKNLALAGALGAETTEIAFPWRSVPHVGEPVQPYALMNPGAAWPNKQWPAQRFGAVAAYLARRYSLESLVLWGPHEEGLARVVVAASNGAAQLAPPTSIADLLALARGARIAVSGDTGPLHLAAAAGTPLVGLYGPTNPARNGPWRPADATISRFPCCECRYRRRCHRQSRCIDEISVDEVQDALDRRLTT